MPSEELFVVRRRSRRRRSPGRRHRPGRRTWPLRPEHQGDHGDEADGDADEGDAREAVGDRVGRRSTSGPAVALPAGDGGGEQEHEQHARRGRSCRRPSSPRCHVDTGPSVIGAVGRRRRRRRRWRPDLTAGARRRRCGPPGLRLGETLLVQDRVLHRGSSSNVAPPLWCRPSATIVLPKQISRHGERPATPGWPSPLRRYRGAISARRGREKISTRQLQRW